LTKSINSPYSKLSHEIADAVDILANGTPQQAASELPKFNRALHALNKLRDTAGKKEAEAQAFVSSTDIPDDDDKATMALDEFNDAVGKFINVSDFDSCQTM
jgi:hypothetical protein